MVRQSYGFIYGIVLYGLIDRFKEWAEKRWWTKTSFVFLLSGTLGVLYIRFKPIDFWGDYCLRILLGASMTLLILLVIRRFEIGNASLNFLGAVSYEVYLVHGTVFGLLAFVAPTCGSGLYILLSLLATVAISTVIHKISRALLHMKKPQTMHGK